MRSRILNPAWAGPILLAMCTPCATAALVFSPGYGEASFYTDSAVENIVSYDWSSDGRLYYNTSDSSYLSSGVYSYGSGGRETIQAAGVDYAGTGVVSIGSGVYFNNGNYPTSDVYRFDTGTKLTSSQTLPSYALATDGVQLLVTSSADFANTQLDYYMAGISSAPVTLGSISGSSGPAAFDLAGNLFFAPGYGSLKIYRWSATEVAAALADSTANPLTASGNVWVDYTSDFPAASGGTSMLIDADGSVIVSVTDFTNPSAVVRFAADGSGNFETLLTSTDRIGEMRINDGKLYLATENRIVQVIPEPSAAGLFLLAGGLLAFTRRRIS